MDKIVTEALAQVPAVLAIIVTVVLFLRFLNELSKRNDIERKNFAETIAKVAKDCHDHHLEKTEELRDLIKSNHEIIIKNTEVIGRTNHALDRIKV